MSEIVEAKQQLRTIEAANTSPLASILQDPAKLNMLDIDKFERLVQLYQHENERQAKKEFLRALTEFRATCPPVPRRHENHQFQSVTFKTGTKQSGPRMYADMEDIQATVDPVLAPTGLSYSFGSIKIDGEIVSQSTRVSHEGGHSEEIDVSVPWQSKAGASDAQKVASAAKYCQRLGLISALGIRNCDDDVDGSDTGVPSGPTISAQQVETLRGMCETLAEYTDKQAGFYLSAVCRDKGVRSIEELGEAEYVDVTARIAKRIDEAAKEGK